MNQPGRRRLAAVALAFGATGLLAPAALAGDWKLTPFRLRNKKADFSLELGGYLQYDLRSFQWDVEQSTQRSDTADVRRVRTGLQMDWKKLRADFDVDWTGAAANVLNDNEPPYNEPEIKNAYLEYRFAKPFYLRVGTFKVPVGFEFLTSAGKTDFVERSMLANSLGPDREWGVMATGELGKKFDYLAGVFAGDGRTVDQSAGTTVATRLIVHPVKHVDVATSFSYGEVEAEPDHPGTDPDPKGPLGRSPSGWRFYERKFVDGRRLRWGGDAQYTRGPFQVKGELLQLRSQRKGQGSTFDDLPDEVGTGWSGTASWIVTGEKKERTIKPKRSVFKGGRGLLEVAARFESLQFDDAGDQSGFEGAGNRARNLRPSRNRVLWGGVSWLPSDWMRLYANVYAENYLDPHLAPEPAGARFVTGTPHGQGTYVTYVARIMFMIP